MNIDIWRNGVVMNITTKSTQALLRWGPKVEVIINIYIYIRIHHPSIKGVYTLYLLPSLFLFSFFLFLVALVAPISKIKRIEDKVVEQVEGPF